MILSLVLTSLGSWNNSWAFCLVLPLQIVDGEGEIDRVVGLIYLSS